MSLHKEIQLENDICTHLAANGWLYADGDAAQYDRGTPARLRKEVASATFVIRE